MPSITYFGYSSAAINATNNIATLTFSEALVNNLSDIAALKAAITFAADGANYAALAPGDVVAITGSTVTVTFAAPLTGSANKIIVAANSLKNVDNHILTGATTTAAVATNDITAPGYSSAAINAANNIVTLTFSEALVNNLANIAALKAAITFAADGANYAALAAGDVVAIAGSTVTVTFAAPLTGSANKIIVAANSLKDAANNILAVATTTAAVVANDITAPGYSSAAINAANNIVTLTFSEALVNNLADIAALKAAITFAADGANYVALEAGDVVAITGSTVTVTFAAPLTGSANKIIVAANSLKDAANNILTGATTTAAVAADITAPVFALATVNGSTLVMTYTEANTLDATNIPVASAFTVKVGGTAQAAPTNVAVDAAAKTVTLTLAAAIVNGNIVTVSYTDPTAGNDLNATQDAAGNDAATIADQTVTNNTPAPAAPAPSYDPGPSAPTNPTLPTGGGTATLTGGQSVTVTENGKDGTAISLPPPATPTTTGAPAASNSVNVTLPGTGTIGVSSGAIGTQLGVTKVTLPGATTAVNTVTVDQGSASFTASEKGQAVAGLKNGIVVVSGAKNSQVTVDATGPNTTIGVKSADTLIVPTGSTHVAGTKVDLPPPTASGGQAATVNLNIGGHELTIQSSQANTTMTFEVVDIGGVQTPVLAVTGNAQVSSSGEDQPLVSVAGNVIKSGKSGGGSHQVCNTIVQASSDASSDVVHVVTCYIVLEAGSFSAIGGGRGTGTGTGNNFAAIKDGIVWAGETAEFDKSGKVTSAYVGTRSGDTDAVGDDMAPGGGKFAAGGYHVGAFIPRLNGTPLRLNGARLDESIFTVVKNALNVTVRPSTPSQSAQGVLNFNFTGDLINQGVQSANVTYTISSDTASVLPSRRVRVDTSRTDGVSISAEGEVDVAAGGLVTTFVPSVPDPKAFADKLAQVLPGSTSILRWNGSWQVNAADGTTYVGRPLWSYWTAAPDAATFSTLADGNILYSDNGVAQLLFPDFYDYDTLQATFRKELNDPNLTVLPRMDGTAVATVNGIAYIIAPQWNAFQPPAGKPAWWLENEVFYIKNFDGSAQGFTVK